MSTELANPRDKMILPFMGAFYDKVAQPMAWVGFRVLIGLALVYEGLPKIKAPMAQIGFVESLHFYPGWIWSPLLAGMQFFGGMLIAIGLLTRPIALANAVMLAITVYFPCDAPYGTAYLTQEGISLLKSGSSAEIFTQAGIGRLADGGRAFLEQVQEKAEMLSVLWTGGAIFLAAFGGGWWSVDRCLIKREF